ncbi:MAG: hypothetical protein KBD48_01275 [Candidatus Pacebacteria bacterium]|nr:hypothetical protein [Candidatus Paceibacterota bacterium]
MSLKFYKKIIFSFFFLFILFFTHSVFAAEISLIPSFTSYEVGDNIKVRVVLSSSGQSANAVSGNIKFSNNTLTLDSISKSNSIVTLWAVEPSFSNGAGTVDFEGVMLAGYSGSNGSVLTLNFKAKAAGTASASFTSSSVLANDGEGTNILTGTNRTSFQIKKVVEKAPVKEIEKVTEKVLVPAKIETKTEAPTPATAPSVLPSIQIQKTSAEDSVDSFAVFSVNSVGKKLKSEYSVEIDGSPVVWLDQDGGVFTTPSLSRGSHKLTISMDTVNSDTLSSSTTFSILSIPAPIITEYSAEIDEGNYIVVKGTAVPDVEVILVFSSTGNDGVESKREATVHADEFGAFTYLSEKAQSGTYNIYAYYKVKSGFDSERSLPLKVNVASGEKLMINKITNTFSIVILMVALLVLLMIVATWGWYKFLTHRDYRAKKLADSRAVMNNKFDMLDTELDQQLNILKKIKSSDELTKEELKFLKQFKKDIRIAEKSVIEDAKKIKNS